MAALRRPFRHLARTLPWTLLTAAILLARIAWPPRDLDATGAVALRDLSLTLLLMAITAVLAHGLGEKLLHLLAPPDLTRLEGSVFSLALGLGALGYLMFGLGMIGLLNTAWITGSILGLSLWVGPQWRAAPGRVRRALSAIHAAWRSAEPLARISAVLAAVIGVLAFIHSLSPPWDYDGLMYHLVGPRAFLNAGRLYPVPESFFLNGPLTGEMLFTLGMAFGDDVFPKLLHFTWGLLLVAATYAAGRRWVGGRGGWLSAVVLLSVPALPVWAAFAYIDVTWSVFEFLALMAAVIWWSSRSPRWLVFSGLMAGLAMGTKYLGMMGFGVIGLFIAGASLLRGGWKSFLTSSLTFGMPAIVVACPWYVKNAIWLGNPVFPLFFGARGWSAGHLEMYSAFLSSFGVGRSALDYLLLPWNVGAESRRGFLERSVGDFGAVMFAQEALPPGSRVLMIGDARSYYCPVVCRLPDHFAWADEIRRLDGVEALPMWFTTMGFTHVLFDQETMDFLLQHDPEGAIRASLTRLQAWREAGCLREVFASGQAILLAVSCP